MIFYNRCGFCGGLVSFPFQQCRECAIHFLELEKSKRKKKVV